jgi:hypothetical protein
MTTITGTINGNSIAGYVVSLRRVQNICGAGQSVVLELSPDYPNTITPSDAVAISEQGTLVFTGRVLGTSRGLTPDVSYRVNCADEYAARAVPYFIDSKYEIGFNDDGTPITNFQGEDVAGLLGYLCGLAGLSYEIVSTGGNRQVAVGTQIGLRSVHDAIEDVIAYSAYYHVCLPTGVVRFGKINRKQTPDYTFYSSGSSGTPLDYQYTSTDEQARDTIKVYGGFTIGATGENRKILSVAYNNIGLTPARIAAVASPMVQTQQEADRLSGYMIGELGVRDALSIASCTIPGNPAIRVGQTARIYDGIAGSSGSFDKTDVITSLSSVWDDKNGYRQNVTIGERCPRIGGWSIEANRTNKLWIACHARGTADPQDEKLVWVGDYGAGGQPDYNLIKGIPQGKIMGMQVLHDESALFMLMYDPSSAIESLWVSADPTAQNGTWTKLIQTGDTISGAYTLDANFFNIAGIGSIQAVNNSFFVGARGYNGSLRQHFYGVYSGGVLSWTQLSNRPYLSATVSDNLWIDYNPGIDEYSGKRPVGSATVYAWTQNFSFDMPVTNGAVRVYGTGGLPGNIWINDLLTAYYHNALKYSATSFTLLRRDGVQVFQGSSGVPFNSPRGDYAGAQVQFVDSSGKLWLATDGSSFSNVATWNFSGSSDGVVECISYTNPATLAWFPTVNSAYGADMSKLSVDGGATWGVMNGNWWGAHHDVIAGTAMQSAGTFNLIDVHPTFTQDSL